MNDTDQRFEERLLTELRAVVATNRAPLAAPQVQRTRSLRQPLMAGGTLVGAGVITAAFLLTGATSPASTPSSTTSPRARRAGNPASLRPPTKGRRSRCR
jgi:hypothetical protein